MRDTTDDLDGAPASQVTNFCFAINLIELLYNENAHQLDHLKTWLSNEPKTATIQTTIGL